MKLIHSNFDTELNTSLSIDSAYADEKDVGDIAKITSDALLKRNEAMVAPYAAISIAMHKVPMAYVATSFQLKFWTSSLQTVCAPCIMEEDVSVAGRNPENVVKHTNAGVYFYSKQLER